MAKIKAAIQKLSVADQQSIARHLGARLAEATDASGHSARDEGIRFLAQNGTWPASSGSRGRQLRQRAEATR